MHEDEAERACAALKNLSESLYVSTPDGVAHISLRGEVLGHAQLAGAGALCVGEKSLFCADDSGVIWRLSRKSLLPESVMGGGPGICDLCLSRNESRLYALLGEADSVLMIDGQTGRPLLVNRCGCNPSQILLCGDLLAAAGGESGKVHLYDADTLVCRNEISMPGPVCAVALAGSRLYALCLTPQLSTLLVAMEGERKQLLNLEGMPGALLIHGKYLYAATQGLFHVFDLESLRLMKKIPAAGRPSQMVSAGQCVIAYDPLSQRVYAMREGESWKMICAQANAMCISGEELTGGSSQMK